MTRGDPCRRRELHTAARHIAALILGIWIFGLAPLAAQAPPGGESPTPLAVQADQLAATPVLQERRACEGCPPRSVGKALLEATIVNVFYETANLIRGQVTAHISPKSWWANMQQGWVWDLDDFTVNQVGHPYQGNNYYNSGRGNGLSFYESAAVAAFGSATWEYFGETNSPSLNDFINTTLGGIALGEMFHRTAWLVRDPQASGRGRLWREIGATAIDPVTGANRFLNGDSSRLADKPPDMIPSDLAMFASAGVLWRGTQGSAFTATGEPYLELDGIYGNPDEGRSRTPYEAFSVRLRMGGGSGFSEARVRGRLAGQPLGGYKVHFAVVQDYDYQNNDAYTTGAQSFEAALGVHQDLGWRVRLSARGWGGLTILGAIDSLPAGVTERPRNEPVGSAGQGISEGPRYYDYGPGANFGANANFARDGRLFASVFYEGRHLYSLDGVRANHLMQRARVDLLLPVRGPLGMGVTGEYFDRRTFYQNAARTRVHYHFPQVRAFFTWGLQ